MRSNRSRTRCWYVAMVLALAMVLAPACAGHSKTRDVQTESDRASPEVARTFRGFASFYGAGFAGRKTASGEVFDPQEMVAAHRTLPFGTRVRVTNLSNGRSVIVRIVDRGPYSGRNTIIDLSSAAARELGFVQKGRTRVTVEVLVPDTD